MQAQELLRELKRTVDELQAFNEIGRTLTSTLDVSEVLRIIMDKVSEVLRPGNWSLLLVDEKAGDLFFELAVGEGAEALKPLRVAIGEGIAGWVAREGQPVLLDEASGDPRFAPRFDAVSRWATGSVLAVPLRSKGRVLGVMELVNVRGAKAFTPDDLRTLATIADYAAIAIENARNFERIRELTLLDDHTGLYNARHLYRSLEAELSRARRFGRSLSLLFFDLDRFKLVNDRHGHQAGSAVLKEIGEVMCRALRAMDVPIRYGGDEFVVLLPEADRKQAQAVADRLRRAINETHFLASRGLDVRVTASFGVATFPDDGATTEDLLRLADAAMYRVKETTRDAVAHAVRETVD
jgi:diguanylate cyclase (GGDEF)-like protein